MQHLEGNGTPVLYIGRRFLKVNVVQLAKTLQWLGVPVVGEIANKL